ncbi:MAG: hypothetical protein DRI73_04235 [Bacteroidetes bacterium]|nr:MAG: hypothetical protein DRI73_04235 [Bacteroidota bacterium]
MKTITLTIGLFILAIFYTAAQKENEYKTLNAKDEVNTLFKKPHSNGGYGGISFGYTNINNKNTFIAGGKGGWILDHGLVLGLAGYGFTNNLNYNIGNNERILAGGYGGLLIEPIIFPKSPVHVSFPVLIGGGGLTSFVNSGYWDPYDYPATVYFIFVPGVELELNIVSFFRIAIGVDYRFTPDIILNDTAGNQLVPTDVMRGFSANLVLKFGKF